MFLQGHHPHDMHCQHLLTLQWSLQFQPAWILCFRSSLWSFDCSQHNRRSWHFLRPSRSGVCLDRCLCHPSTGWSHPHRLQSANPSIDPDCFQHSGLHGLLPFQHYWPGWDANGKTWICHHSWTLLDGLHFWCHPDRHKTRSSNSSILLAIEDYQLSSNWADSKQSSKFNFHPESSNLLRGRDAAKLWPSCKTRSSAKVKKKWSRPSLDWDILIDSPCNCNELTYWEYIFVSKMICKLFRTIFITRWGRGSIMSFL